MQIRQLPTARETRENLWQEGYPPALPGRFLMPVYHQVDDLMEGEFAGAIGMELKRVADRMNKTGNHWSMACTMDVMPKAMAVLRRSVMRHVADACQKTHVAEFDLTDVTMSAHLHHHDNESAWFCDAQHENGELDESCRLGFTYFLHSSPVMFTEGLVEFHDGSTIDPKHNRLVFTHPLQRRRVQKTNCYSGELLHGRWSICGRLHGPAPEGYTELAKRLLG